MSKKTASKPPLSRTDIAAIAIALDKERKLWQDAPPTEIAQTRYRQQLRPHAPYQLLALSQGLANRLHDNKFNIADDAPTKLIAIEAVKYLDECEAEIRKLGGLPQSDSRDAVELSHRSNKLEPKSDPGFSDLFWRAFNTFVDACKAEPAPVSAKHLDRLYAPAEQLIREKRYHVCRTVMTPTEADKQRTETARVMKRNEETRQQIAKEERILAKIRAEAAAAEAAKEWEPRTDVEPISELVRQNVPIAQIARIERTTPQRILQYIQENNLENPDIADIAKRRKEWDDPARRNFNRRLAQLRSEGA